MTRGLFPVMLFTRTSGSCRRYKMLPFLGVKRRCFYRKVSLCAAGPSHRSGQAIASLRNRLGVSIFILWRHPLTPDYKHDRRNVSVTETKGPSLREGPFIFCFYFFLTAFFAAHLTAKKGFLMAFFSFSIYACCSSTIDCCSDNLL